MAVVLAAAVITAPMIRIVFMVMTAEVAASIQGPGNESFYDLIDVSGSSADDFDADLILNDVNGLWEFMFPGTKSELLRMVLGKIIVFPEQISFVLKVEGLKDLAEEMAMTGFFNMTHEENTELFPEAEQEVLEDGSIKLTLRVDSKRIDGHRHLVILAPGAERLKQTSLLRVAQSCDWSGCFDFLSAFFYLMEVKVKDTKYPEQAYQLGRNI